MTAFSNPAPNPGIIGNDAEQAGTIAVIAILTTPAAARSLQVPERRIQRTWPHAAWFLGKLSETSA